MDELVQALMEQRRTFLATGELPQRGKWWPYPQSGTFSDETSAREFVAVNRKRNREFRIVDLAGRIVVTGV